MMTTTRFGKRGRFNAMARGLLSFLSNGKKGSKRAGEFMHMWLLFAKEDKNTKAPFLHIIMLFTSDTARRERGWYPKKVSKGQHEVKKQKEETLCQEIRRPRKRVLDDGRHDNLMGMTMKREATKSNSNSVRETQRERRRFRETVKCHWGVSFLSCDYSYEKGKQERGALSVSLSLRNNGIKMSKAIREETRLFLTQLNGGTTNYTRKKEEKEKRQFSQLLLGEKGKHKTRQEWWHEETKTTVGDTSSFVGEGEKEKRWIKWRNKKRGRRDIWYELWNGI